MREREGERDKEREKLEREKKREWGREIEKQRSLMLPTTKDILSGK